MTDTPSAPPPPVSVHPYAWPDNHSGANGMHAGDRIVYVYDGRHGVADEFLPDGDTFVTFDDGKHETVKWRLLEREKETDGIQV